MGFHRSSGARSSMKRRAFILGSTAALAGLTKALAQRNLRVVGIWWSPLQVREILTRYKARLAELGWMEGRNVRFEARAWDGDTANMRQQADELVAMHPDVIVALSNPAVAILKPVSGSLPIVFGMVADPAGSGFIENLARPGGNMFYQLRALDGRQVARGPQGSCTGNHACVGPDASGNDCPQRVCCRDREGGSRASQGRGDRWRHSQQPRGGTRSRGFRSERKWRGHH